MCYHIRPVRGRTIFGTELLVQVLQCLCILLVMWCLKVPWHENVSLWGIFNINMSSPSLPMVPQWLEILIGVNQSCSTFEKTKAQTGESGIFPICRHTGKGYLPFSALPVQRICPAHEKMSNANTILFFPRETSWLANERSMAVAQCL